MNDFFAREFWRFVSVQEEVAKLAVLRSITRRCRTQPHSIWKP